MFNDRYADSLLRQGIIEAKAGLKDTARKYFERALIVDPGDLQLQAEVNYWLSEIEDDPQKKRTFLEEVLSINPAYAPARRSLAILDGKLNREEMIDPNALPGTSGEPMNVDADRFMCKKCGARLVFAPDGQTLMCEHCQDKQAPGLENGEASEQDFFVAMATARGHSKPVATQVFHCKGCGAEFVLAPGTLSSTCAYCSSPHVFKLEKLRDLVQPEGIIPHKFTRTQAAVYLVEWVEENQIVPSTKVEQPRGLYMPVWTFDIGGSLECYGEVYESNDDFDFGKQSSSIRQVKQSYPVLIDDLLVPASKKLMTNAIPLCDDYSLEDVQAYDPRFLANWPVEVYDVPMANASLEARAQANKLYQSTLKEKFPDLMNFRTSSANLSVSSFKLILLPLWMTTISLGNKEYPWLLDGQTGTVEASSLLKMARKQTKKSASGLANWLDGFLGEE